MYYGVGKTFEPPHVLVIAIEFGTIARQSKINPLASMAIRLESQAEGLPTDARALRTLALRGIEPTPYQIGHLTWCLTFIPLDIIIIDIIMIIMRLVRLYTSFEPQLQYCWVPSQTCRLERNVVA